MKEEAQQLLDDILGSWHNWCSGYRLVQEPSVCAMFAGTRSSRQWDSENEVNEQCAHNSTMKAVDFHINELDHVSRTALQMNAKNIATGRVVWNSVRLPTNPMDRQLLICAARSALLGRLQSAGVI